jgi:hypothetical protein
MLDLNALNELQALSLCRHITDPYPVGSALRPYKLLEGRTLPAAQTHEACIAFLQDYFAAIKDSYRQHPDLVYEHFNKQLAEHRWSDLFLDTAKGRDTVARMLDCDIFHRNSVNPEHFAEALTGVTECDAPRYVDLLIAQARQLAYITDKPLAETMKERLLHVGLTPLQAGVLADVTHAYENKTHGHLLAELKRIHDPKALRAKPMEGGKEPLPASPKNAQQAELHNPATSESTPLLGNPREAAAAENLAERESAAARAVHYASSSAWKWGIVTATVTLGAVIGYWVWRSRQNEKKNQDSKNQIATGRAR